MDHIDTRNSGPGSLTKNCKAATILRSKLESGEIRPTEDHDIVHKSHQSFSKHTEDRISIFFIRRVMQFEGK